MQGSNNNVSPFQFKLNTTLDVLQDSDNMMDPQSSVSTSGDNQFAECTEVENDTLLHLKVQESRNLLNLPPLNLTASNDPNQHNQNNTNNHLSVNTQLDLNDEIMKDLYDSLCAWHEDEIDDKYKGSMNMDEFIIFFEEYIYNASSINDSNQICRLDANKQHITRSIFNYICDKNSDKISFDKLLGVIDELKLYEFKKILCNNSNHKSVSPLDSIPERTPLDDGDMNNDENMDNNKYNDYSPNRSNFNWPRNDDYNDYNDNKEEEEEENRIRTASITSRNHNSKRKTRDDNIYDNDGDDDDDEDDDDGDDRKYDCLRRKSQEMDLNEIDHSDKKQIKKRLQRVKDKLKKIVGLKRKLKKGEKLESNQKQLIKQENTYKEEKEFLETKLSEISKNNQEIPFNKYFMDQLYKQQCTKQRDQYKKENEKMRNKLVEFQQKYEILQEQNNKLMNDVNLMNVNNNKLEIENDALKQRLAELEKQMLAKR